MANTTENWQSIDTKKEFSFDCLGLDGVKIITTERDTYGNLKGVILQDAAGHRVKVAPAGDFTKLIISKITEVEQAADESAA